MSWENVEEAFKELDQREFSFFATALGSYRKALMKEGFTRRETARLVETYAKFVYEMSIEDWISQKRREEEEALDQYVAEVPDEDNEDDDDVDLDDDELV